MGITITKTEETITRRERPEEAEKITQIIKALVNVVANEDLGAVLVAVLKSMQDLGYKLRDEPGALLDKLKRSV